jgi:ABC-type sugar transport system permease subunit
MALKRTRRLIQEIQKIWPLFPAAAYLLGFLIITAVYLLGMSFTDMVDGSVSVSSAPFVRVYSMPEFREALANTVAFVVAGTPLELLVGLALALMLYQTFRFRGIVRSMFVIPLAVPALVTATLLFILFDYPGGHINHLLLGRYDFFPALVDMPINWRNSKVFALGVSLAGKVWRDMPISMLILLAGLNAIDTELFDAAKSMGASRWQRLRHVVLPLLIPSISAVVLLRSIEMWKEFIFPFVLAGRHNLLGTLIESLYNDWGYTRESAVVALSLVVCIILSIVILFYALEGFRKILVRI